MNTRWLADRVITKVLKDGQSLNCALDDVLLNCQASQQDQAFVKAICYGVCRYYHHLDFILNLLVTKPIKEFEVKSLILIGLYQIEYMRVKPHAAVSETVQAAKKLPWARGLINAVLRNYLRNQEKFQVQAETNKFAKFSHPDWLIERIQQDWQDHAETILLANNQPPPLTLRVNLSKISREDYLQALLASNLTASISNVNSTAIILEHPTAIEPLPGFNEGWFAVQDAAAQLAACLLDAQPGHRVLDVCAAPGGKTTHILESQPRLTELVAVDIDEKRMARVKQNMQRLKLSATFITGNAAEPEQWWDGNLFDRILLDAPCSATGVIRRHPDIKLLRRPEDIRTTADLQKKILAAIWSLLAPGGMLLYATCSILKQENEEQMQDFLANHSDAVELPISSVSWGIPEKCGRQIITGEASMDGFYYARISKK